MSAPENEATAPAPPAPAETSQTDVDMTDATAATSDVPPTISEPPTTSSLPQPQPPPQQPPSEATPAQSPAPAKTGTPLRNELQGSGSGGGGGGTGSRAQSAHPDQSTMPSQAAVHGAPVRQYLNSHVTGTLLEGMKKIGKEQPSDPLRVLGEFLIQKSKELEGK